jgi:ADP-ribosylglycohydrolase
MVHVAKPYFNRRWWGANFYKWLTESQTPYNSWGNGSAMRVSSVGWIAESEEEVRYFSKLVTEVSHDHPEGIKGAEAVAMAIYLARNGTDMATIRQRMIEYYPSIEKMTVDNIRPGYGIDDQGGSISCQGSVPEAIVCFLEATSTEDAIRNAISLGGDADTQAAITGSMAEAYFGVPFELEDKTLTYLTDELRSIYYSFDLIKKPRIKRI